MTQTHPSEDFTTAPGEVYYFRQAVYQVILSESKFPSLLQLLSCQQRQLIKQCGKTKQSH